MKTIRVTFEDSKFKKLKKEKGDKTWYEFIIDKVEYNERTYNQRM